MARQMGRKRVLLRITVQNRTSNRLRPISQWKKGKHGRAHGEVDEMRWVVPDELAAVLAQRPEVFAAWTPTVPTTAMTSLLR